MQLGGKNILRPYLTQFAISLYSSRQLHADVNKSDQVVHYSNRNKHLANS